MLIDRGTREAADLAAHLALAIGAYRRELSRRGAAEPEGLAYVEAFLLAAVIRGQIRTDADTEVALVVSPGNDDPMLTVTQAADRLGVNERTIRRWVAAGQLPAEGHGRTIRVHATDLRRREPR